MIWLALLSSFTGFAYALYEQHKAWRAEDQATVTGSAPIHYEDDSRR